MRVGIVTPAPPRSRYGNRVTALRWARILQALGHNVRITRVYRGEPYDLMLALHARRSHAAIRSFHRKYPDRPLIVALTGTDLYRDLPKSRRAQRSLEMAARIIALQPKALEELRPDLREKTRVIYQSVAKARKALRQHRTSAGVFQVCVIGHLRAVKDPFRLALAARALPQSSRIRVAQAGGAMNAAMAARARAEMKINPRYRWLNEISRPGVRRLLAQSRICVLSSKLEGGANILSEAIVAGVPVLASRVPGNTGLLGQTYPGYFQAGDTRGLTRLLIRAETDGPFLSRLRTHCRKRAPVFQPAREKAAWRAVLREFSRQRLRASAKAPTNWTRAHATRDFVKSDNGSAAGRAGPSAASSLTAGESSRAAQASKW